MQKSFFLKLALFSIFTPNFEEIYIGKFLS